MSVCVSITDPLGRLRGGGDRFFSFGGGAGRSCVYIHVCASVMRVVGKASMLLMDAAFMCVYLRVLLEIYDCWKRWSLRVCLLYVYVFWAFFMCP
jgi:hypothetical protein